MFVRFIFVLLWLCCQDYLVADENSKKKKAVEESNKYPSLQVIDGQAFLRLLQGHKGVEDEEGMENIVGPKRLF